MDHGAASYRRFLDGDQEGLVELIRDYKDGLILYLNGFVGDFHTAEELTEDTFVKLATKRPRFAGRSSFKTWLYAIGRNVARDYLRGRERAALIPLDSCPEPAAEELEHAYLREERKIQLHRAIQTLKPEYRQVLWLVYFEEFRLKEAAAVMKKSVHGIETLVYRARQSLKATLEKEGFDYEEL